MRDKAFITLVLIVLHKSSFAEYRVYQYIIKAKSPFSINQKGYAVTSTLSPQSYLSYHGGASTLKLDLIRSWICRGNTSKKEYCESPYSQLKREIASQDKASKNEAL